ncbi:DUF4352 domain-containing protein [Holzapfeliella sp. He02]|uniref:DUF4352 domain-containing protein n=1 Tax=Holzapfeliella saturejae TaxID=3082953 RepID=A0ABU8SI19_9LACO
MKKTLTIVTLASAMLLAGCSSKEATVQKGSGEQQTTQSSEAPKTNVGGIGDTVTVDKISYTVDKVELTDQRNEYTDKDLGGTPKYVVKVSYTVKNGDDKDRTLLDTIDMYDPADKKLNRYALYDNVLSTIDAGKNASSTYYVATNDLGKFEMNFKPNMLGNDKAKFAFEVKE